MYISCPSATSFAWSVLIFLVAFFVVFEVSESFLNWFSLRFIFEKKGNEVLIRVILIGTLSIDNEIHDDDVRNRRRIGSRISFSSEKTKVKQFVVLRRRRVLVL